MQKGIIEFSNLFKERDNPLNFQICIAKLISKSPLILKTNDNFFLSKEYENLIISDTLNKKIGEININDEIIVIPTVDATIYYAIDKVVRI